MADASTGEHVLAIGDHETWIHLIPGVRELDHALAERLAAEGGWLFGTPIHKFPHVYTALLVLVLLTIVGLMYRGRVAGEAGIVPQKRFGLRAFVDGVADFTRQQMAGIMGEKAARAFLPFIGAFAFFILFSNLLGLIPGFLPPTDSLNTTFACSILIFLATHIYGFKVNGMGHFKHMAGPVLALAPLIFVIEVIGHLARPASLSLRLAGNMIGDHMALSNFLGLTYLVVPIAILGLGVIVCLVQTLVFCLLSTVYIGLAIEPQDHHH
ncbi:MAG: F0F1 ATP synthase subunit A [bacterium]|nr:F0F1 ATP synthase subunit A [Myxococcales bacterium]MCB9553130.1 F0F1 ATP synthase subunit A [Myxococcales bacterium]